jgi:bla regulator protein blaR1
MLNIANVDSAALLAQLAIFAVRTLALASCVGLGLALSRPKSTSLRLLSWTAVLYAAFAIPVLGWLLPSLAIPVPAFLQQAKSSVSAPANIKPETVEARRTNLARQQVKAQTNDSTAEYSSANQSSTIPKQLAPEGGFPQPPMRWSTVATAIYLAVSVSLLARFAVGFILARRLVRSSLRIHDQRVRAKISSRAQLDGLSFIPQVHESALISVPVTIGAFRSAIVLPCAWHDWDDEKLDAVIAHEMSHVARRDALTQRVSLLHRAIFWFSPLAWWLNRHLADLAEQASDEAALSCGADRNQYARTLLGFFEALHVAPGRVWWHGVAMANVGQAEKRLERILGWKGAVTMSLKKSVVVIIVALAIPVVYLAASARPISLKQDAHEAMPQVPPAPPQASLSTPAIAPAPGAPARVAIPAVPEAPGALAPAAPAIVGVVAPPALAGQSHSSFGHGLSYSYGFDDEQRFVIVSGKTDALTMSGSSEDAHHVERLRKQISGDFIWFSRDEKSYIIRDQATIDRARKLWAPQEELGKQQEELGKQQEALGKQQEELGARMEQIQVKVPDMTAQLDKLRAEMKALSSGATAEQVGHLQSEIGELQSQLGEIQSHAGEQQGKLGEEMGALGEKQGKLGEQQGKLGEQQEKLAKEASRAMKSLLDEALKNGTAKPEPQSGSEGSGTL